MPPDSSVQIAKLAARHFVRTSISFCNLFEDWVGVQWGFWWSGRNKRRQEDTRERIGYGSDEDGKMSMVTQYVRPPDNERARLTGRSERRVGLQQDTLGSTIPFQLVLGIVRVELNLYISSATLLPIMTMIK